MSRLDRIKQMLAAEPADVFLNFSLAMELVKEGRQEDAVAQFARVSELDPAYVPAYFQRANALVAMGRKADAKAVLQLGIAAARKAGDKHAASEMGQMLSLLG
ncbi:MAG: tetratricopeptide repeat protein [Phycisphaerae bacterium]|nr:tetratricopeptide repeat protein [Phycisphaerae bacterium]